MQVNWLDHIVIGAQVQAAYAIGHGITRGQYQHGGCVFARAQGLQHVQPVLERQAQVQHGCGIAARYQFALGCHAVTYPVHLEAQLAQTCAQSVAQH